MHSKDDCDTIKSEGSLEREKLGVESRNEKETLLHLSGGGQAGSQPGESDS